MRRDTATDPVVVAAESLGVPPSECAAPERIKLGLTNESWIVRTASDAVVVRISNREHEALQIDRQSEAIVLGVVAAAGIGAPIVLCAPERHVLVTRYVPGSGWTSRDARQPRNLQRLAESLRALHALPLPVGVHRLYLMDAVCGYWHTLIARGLAAQAGSLKKRARARDYIADLASDASTCLCHNDVHHLNVIDNGRLCLVDWEYAGVGDPYFDLASVCCYHALPDASRRELLRVYLGYDSVTAAHRLQQMCWVFHYIRDLWFAVREME